MDASLPFSGTGYASFDEMYRSERSLIHGIVCRMVKYGGAAADDLTQDIFVSIFRNVGAYVPQSNKVPKESFRSWICTIAKNKVINYLNRRKTEQAYSGRVAMDKDNPCLLPSPNPEDLLIEKEELEGVVQAINGLPDHGIRETSRLRFLEGQSYQEISDQLRVPKGTVMSRLYRARRQIKPGYEDYL